MSGHANKMQALRRFSRDFNDGPGPVTLTQEEARLLVSGIDSALHVLDTMWEGFAGRKLTQEEQYGRSG